MIVYRCYHLKLVSVTQTLIVNYMYNVTLFEIHALNSLIVVFFLDHLQNLFISVPSLYKRSNLDNIENIALFLKAKSMKNLENKEQDIDGWLLVLCYVLRYLHFKISFIGSHILKMFKPCFRMIFLKWPIRSQPLVTSSILVKNE